MKYETAALFVCCMIAATMLWLAFSHPISSSETILNDKVTEMCKKTCGPAGVSLVKNDSCECNFSLSR